MSQYIVYFGSKTPFNEAMKQVVEHKISEGNKLKPENIDISVPTFIEDWCRDKTEIENFVLELQGIFWRNNVLFVHVFDTEEKKMHLEFIDQIIGIGEVPAKVNPPNLKSYIEFLRINSTPE